MTDQPDEALKYTTKIALFLCSQNMTLKDIFDSINEMSNLVALIAQACNEQATASEEISKNLSEIDSVTKNSVNSARQSADISEELNQNVHTLNNVLNHFSTKKIV